MGRRKNGQQWHGGAEALTVGLVAALLAALVPDTASAASGNNTYEALTKYCWSCEFVGAFAQITDAFARSVYDVFRDDVETLLDYVFAIWLLIAGARLMLPIGEDISDILQDLVKRCAIFMLAIFLVSDSGKNAFWDYGYESAISVASKGASLILEKVNGVCGVSNPGSSCSYTARALTGTTLPTASSGAIDTSTVKAIVCQIEQMNKVAAGGVAIGVHNMDEVSLWDLSVSPVLTGFLLIVIFGTLMVSFPFHFADNLFRISFLAAFGPILIGCFVFKPTRQYAVTALSGVVQSTVTLIAVAILYALAAVMMSVAPEVAFSDAGISSPTGSNTVVALVETLAGQHKSVAGKVRIEISSPAFWLMAIAGLIAIVMSGRIGGLMGSIFGFRGDTGGMGQAATSIATAAAATTASTTMIIPGMAAGAGFYKLGQWTTIGATRSGQASGLYAMDKVRRIKQKLNARLGGEG